MFAKLRSCKQETCYILNAKNLAPLSISIFSGSKMITSNVIQMNDVPVSKDCFCNKSNASECLEIQWHFFGEITKIMFFGINLF